MATHENRISTPGDWRKASRAARAASAETLTLPSGATILATRPAPLEWILAGRVPQRLLAAALATEGSAAAAPPHELSREDVLELARFAADLVRASVVEPAIGEAPDEIRFDDIPIEDRTCIFEWACRTLRESGTKEDPSSPSADGLERFCAQ
ncbi:MAG: hypothetical protein HY508_10140 [Acidobacteria bacterium]|nr:hypothetical protein [Acidobacteriota bacterium]